MDADLINSIGKVWALFWTTLGVGTIFFPFGTSLAGNVLTMPYWLYIVEAVLFGAYALSFAWSFLDARFRDQHVSAFTRHPSARVPFGVRLFVPYISLVGMLGAAVGFYVHLSWGLRNPGVGTLADFMAAAGGYVSEGYAAGCAVSIAMRVATAAAFVVLLFADAASRNAADLIREHLRKHHGIEKV